MAHRVLLTAESEDLVAELARLRVENARLRGLLGPGRAQRRRSYSGVVDESSPDGAKVALPMSLFGARADVYATRWENTSTGKAGWSPTRRGGWSRSHRRQEYLPLTAEVSTAHLEDRASIGIYPLLPGDTCTLLACDFDKGTLVLDALAYLDACHVNGVPAALERSRSGNGGHVWG
jgi:hypothetical protein